MDSGRSHPLAMLCHGLVTCTSQGHQVPRVGFFRQKMKKCNLITTSQYELLGLDTGDGLKKLRHPLLPFWIKAKDGYPRLWRWPWRLSAFPQLCSLATVCVFACPLVQQHEWPPVTQSCVGLSQVSETKNAKTSASESGTQEAGWAAGGGALVRGGLGLALLSCPGAL